MHLLFYRNNKLRLASEQEDYTWCGKVVPSSDTCGTTAGLTCEECKEAYALDTLRYL